MLSWGFRVTGGFMRPDPASVATAGTSVGSTKFDHHPVPRARRYGHREKARWYAPGAIAVDTLGAGLPVLLVFTTSSQPYPLPAALVAAVAWPGVRAVHLRYTQRLLGESRGLVSTLHDWLTLAGLLAVVQVVSGVSPAPAYALAAIASAPVCSAVYRVLMHRDLTARRRAAQAVRRVLVIGEPGAARTRSWSTSPPAPTTRTSWSARSRWAVVAEQRRAGGRPAGRGTRGTPAQDAAAVLDAVAAHRADLVLVAPGARLTGERLRRLSWALHDAGLPLAVCLGADRGGRAADPAGDRRRADPAARRRARAAAARSRRSSPCWTGRAPRSDCCCSLRCSSASPLAIRLGSPARPSTGRRGIGRDGRARSPCGSSARWWWTPTRARRELAGGQRERRARCSRCAATRGSPGWAGCCAAPRWTNCRS